MTKRALAASIILLIILSAGAYFAMRQGNSEMVRVNSPSRNESISSPITVTGEARGNWYFEASFPIKVIDADGKILGQHYAQAQGDWMTTDFVPFTSTITFSPGTASTGFIVLEKDNPSGLAENAAEVRIPVRFATPSASKTPIQDAVRAELLELGLTKVTLVAASLNNGVLTLTFSDPENQTIGGSARVTMFRERIEAVAKQFDGVASVRLMPEDLFQP